MELNIIEKITNFILNLFSPKIQETIFRTDESVKRIDKDLDDIKKDTKSISEKIFKMEPQVEKLWKRAFAPGHSPRMLNEEGQRVFNQSGIKDIFSKNLENLITDIENYNPKKAYQVEELAEKVMQSLKENPNILESLKEKAYRAGVDVDTILFVGSIHLRDKYIEKHPEITQ